MADACKVNRQFDLAAKYYNIVISEKNTEHSSYWGLLHCKLKCINDTELINTPQRLGNFAEYNSAIQSAGASDDKSIDHYLSVKQAQETQKEKSKTKRLKKKIKIASICVAILLAIVAGGIGVGYYFTPVVTFYNWDGTKICVVETDRGGKATPSDMSKFTRPNDYYAKDYKFVGWSEDVSSVRHRMKATAVFEGTPIYYT